MSEYNINQLSGKLKEIATYIDQKKGNKNGKIDGKEVSVFETAKQRLSQQNSSVNSVIQFIKDSYDYLCDMVDSGIETVKSMFGSDTKSKAPVKTQKTAKTAPVRNQHAETVKKIADSWAKTYNISNKNGEFTAFVEKLYKVAAKLNLTQTNSGNWDKSKYPTKQDQVIDEMLAAFANESQFNPGARSKSGTYHGIFQFSDVAMNDMVEKGTKLKKVTMSQFEKLSRLEQLDYMLEYTLLCKNTYSKLGNSPISPKQAYEMWEYPSLGNPANVVQTKKRKISGAAQIKLREDTIKTKQAERERFAPLKLN